MKTTTNHAVASFRDPAGSLCWRDGRLLRAVSAAGVDCARLFLDSPALAPFRAAGRLVATRELDAAEAGLPGCALALEHEPIFFPSYPMEWSAAMLAEAGRLTLDLMEAALAARAGLKDATPYNVLFDGSRALFADALSIERRDPRDPLWRAAAQFERTFLYPLAGLRCGIPLSSSFALRREGPEPEELAAWAGPVRRWLPPYLTLATLPARLGHNREVKDERFYRARQADSPEQARFILSHTVAGLRRQLRRLGATGRTASVWSGYQAEDCHYADADLAAKDAFVRAALGRLKPGSAVLDIGANLGRYSRMAAQMGHRVVAIDADPVVMGQLFETARAAGENILPLVVDLANPTPAAGWANSETRSFLDRADGRFDCVLMLAVVHHLMVTHGVPLAEIAALAARLTPRGTVVAEYVGPRDAMFRRLLRGRAELHAGYGPEAFEAGWRARFDVAHSATLAHSGRVLCELNAAGSSTGRSAAGAV
jgi:SAM-dependent methyltransferase